MKYLFTGILLITLSNSVGSILSRILQFEFVYLAPIPLLIYGCIGFFCTRNSKFIMGIGIGALLGLYNSTIGWELAKVFKANTQLNVATWMDYAFNMLLGASAALLGGVIAWIFKKRPAREEE